MHVRNQDGGADVPRHCRLRQLGKAGRFFWSIHELEVWER